MLITSQRGCFLDGKAKKLIIIHHLVSWGELHSADRHQLTVMLDLVHDQRKSIQFCEIFLHHFYCIFTTITVQLLIFVVPVDLYQDLLMLTTEGGPELHYLLFVCFIDGGWQ